MQDPSTYQQIKPQFPEHEQLKCPRCESTNTKFCYYNNYNLSQPRHLCKNCKRYWTKGGTLRNIPVGGGRRKNTKRISSSSKPKCSSSSTVQTVYGSSAAFEQDCLRIDSFGSVLGSNGQFLYPHGSTVQLGEFGETPNSKSEMQSGNNNSDNFLRVESGGDSSCCGGGSGGDVWPDLAIYTPSSTFR